MGKAKKPASSSRTAPFRYDGAKDLPASCMPYMGDFVVLSLDPQQSVAHLDDRAKRLASRLESRQYLAVPIMNGTGLPSKFKPTNEFFFALVRQRTDVGSSERVSTPPSYDAVSNTVPGLSVPIVPHAAASTLDHPPLVAVADFPFPDCEVDLAVGSLYVRVTNVKRDRTPVLPLPFKEVIRLQRIRRAHMRRVAELKAATRAEQRLRDSGAPPTSEGGHLHHAPAVNESPKPTGKTKDMDRVLMSALLNYAGNPDIPVANVWYDLNAVDVVKDPSALKREEEAILRIMRDAEVRMARAGIQPQFPSHSMPWEDERMNDLGHLVQDSMTALRKVSSSIISPARAILRRSWGGGWKSLKRTGAQNLRAQRTTSPASISTPPTRAPSPSTVPVVQQREASPAPTTILTYEETQPSSALDPTSVAQDLPVPFVPAAPAPPLAELPPSPTQSNRTQEDRAVGESLSFTPNAPLANVYSSPDTSPALPGEHLPSRKVGRSGTAISEESASGP
ncbi:unnamed protein product [Peniophora sp. CBMAI 1063]|nr:unnamed protein product [Peniophora sp. CBMAI 1063]